MQHFATGCTEFAKAAVAACSMNVIQFVLSEGGLQYLGEAFPLPGEREGALGQEHGRGYGVPCPGHMENYV